MRRLDYLVLSLLIGCALAPIPANAQGEPLEGVLTSWPIEVDGTARLEMDGASVLMDPTNAFEGIRLDAESVRIEREWKRGVHTAEGLFGVTLERDGDLTRLDDAVIRFEAFQGEPVMLAFPKDGRDGDLATQWNSISGVSVSPDEDVNLVEVGQSPQTISSNEDRLIGFWYDVEGPVVAAQGQGDVEVSGSFSLFVHDMRIRAEGEAKRWSNWTGYWEEDVATSTKEYEIRVTQIHVKNGTLRATPERTMELYAPQLEADVDGVVMVRGVTGEIVHRGRLFVFKEDALRLDGEGRLDIGAVEPRGLDEIYLRMETSEGFSLMTSVEGEPMEGASFLSWLLPGLIGFLALVLLAGVTWGRSGVVLLPPGTSREKSYARLMRRGQQARDAQDWRRASSCFRKATRIKKDDPVAWYEWAHSELEAGDGEEAERVARSAQNVPGVDRLDLLDLQASAAWQRGDRSGFEEHLTELALRSPGMARGLINDFGVDVSSLGSKVQRALAGDKRQGELDGYV